MGRAIEMKLLKRIGEIIAKINLSNKDKGHSSDSMPPMLIAKEKDANKIERNKWGFPVNKNPPAFFRDRK
tara:strand:+ start:169 stop:378 length:210 start_codon:yes stop_codon:yes gene_type:complete